MEEPKKFLIKYNTLVSGDIQKLVEKDIKNFLTGEENIYFLPLCVSSILVFDSGMNLLYEIKNKI